MMFFAFFDSWIGQASIYLLVGLGAIFGILGGYLTSRSQRTSAPLSKKTVRYVLSSSLVIVILFAMMTGNAVSIRLCYFLLSMAIVWVIWHG